MPMFKSLWRRSQSLPPQQEAQVLLKKDSAGRSQTVGRRRREQRELVGLLEEQEDNFKRGIIRQAAPGTAETMSRPGEEEFLQFLLSLGEGRKAPQQLDHEVLPNMSQLGVEVLFSDRQGR